jgi:hypothetical protein
MWADTLIARLVERGVLVWDLRGKLPRNTSWPNYRRWTRRSQGISRVAHHYPAGPPRPEGPHDEVARLRGWAQYHVNTVWGYTNGQPIHAPTLAYHLFNAGSGTIYVCNDLEDVTYHANNANGIAVGVLHDVGEGQEPNAAQLAAAQDVSDALNWLLGLSHANHWGHGELTQYGNSTACPGLMQRHVRRYRETGVFFVPGHSVNMGTAIVQRAALAYRRGETRGPALSGEYDHNGRVRQRFSAATCEWDPATGVASWVEINLHPE